MMTERVTRDEYCAGGLSSLTQYRMPERGARIARREERVYWALVSDEQRREAECSAGRMQRHFHHGLLVLLCQIDEFPCESAADHF